MINVEEELLQLKARVANLEQLLGGETAKALSKSTKKISIREFILSSTVKDSTQTVLVIAYYLEKFNQETSFNIADISSAFQAAKETPPSNINDRVNSLIRQGFVMKASEKKNEKMAWILTNSGEKAVEELLQKGKAS